LALLSAIVVGSLSDLIVWLQGGRWNAPSLLDLGYEAHLFRSSWFLTSDWHWWIHGALNQVPAPLAALIMAPIFWRLGLVFVRR
jgi:hypothetical protein